MKAKIKLMAFVAGLLSVMPMTSAWASSYNYTATLTGTANPTGAGSVYVADTAENAKKKTNLGTYTKSGSSDSSGNDVKATLYAYAVPEAGYEFTGWTGATVTEGDKCSVSLTCTSKATAQTANVTANFAKIKLPEFGITFATSEAGSYTVDDIPPANKVGLTEVTYVKLASTDPNFLNWKVNDAVVNDNPYTATCLANTTISAVFLTADQVAEVTTFDELTAALANDGKKKITIPAGTKIEMDGGTISVPDGKQLVVDGELWIDSGTLTGTIIVNGILSKCTKRVVQQGQSEGMPFNPYGDRKYWKTSVSTPTITLPAGVVATAHATVVNGAGKTFRIALPDSARVLTVSRDASLAQNHISGISSVSASDELKNVQSGAMFVLLTSDCVINKYVTAKTGFSGYVDCAGNKCSTGSSYEVNGNNGAATFFNCPEFKVSKSVNTTHTFYNCQKVTLSSLNAGSIGVNNFYDCGPTVSISYSKTSSGAVANFYSGTYDSLSASKTQVIYGGRYKANPGTEGAYLAAGKSLRVKTEDSYYVVYEHIAVNVAEIDTGSGIETFETLQAAFDKVGNGQTVRLVQNYEGGETATIAADKNFSLELRGYSLLSTSGKIVNNGTLWIRDSATLDATKETSALNWAIENNGTLEITYGAYNGNFTLNDGSRLITHGGRFLNQLILGNGVTGPTAVADLRGGYFSMDLAAAGLLSQDYLQKSNWVGKFPYALVENTTQSGYEKTWKVTALPSVDLAIYAKSQAVRPLPRAEYVSDADWNRRAELESMLKPYSGSVDCTMSFDRPTNEETVKVYANAKISLDETLDCTMAANEVYRVLITKMLGYGSGYSLFGYDRFLTGYDFTQTATVGVADVNGANPGTVAKLELEVCHTTDRHADPQTPDLYVKDFAVATCRYMLGGKKAAIDRESRRVAYDSLVAAVADAQSGERILIGADTADNVTLAKAGTYTIDPYGFNFTGTVKVADGYTMNTSTAPSAADAQGVQSALATTYVVVDASVVEGAGGTKYPSVAAAIAGETGNEIALTVTANVTETVAVPAGKKVTITVAEGVESKLTVNPDEGAFLVEAKNGATTSYEAKRITEKPVLPTSGVSAKEVSGGNTNDVADASALVTRLMGNAAIERVDNTTVAVLDKVEVTPTMIIDIKSGDQDVIEAATFDVVPKAKEGQSLGETMIKFRLPVEADTDKASAKVSHEGAFFGVVPVSSETVGETVCKFVEVESNAFSPYGYELLGGAEDPVAIIDSVGYATLAAALDAAQAGDTVTLLKDIEGVTNAFEITKAITLNGNGHKIVAAVNENPRDMLSAYLGARVMFQVRSAEGVTFQDLTVDGGETHYYTFLAETKGGVFTVENTQWLHGGEASAGDVAGVGYGAAIHVNGGILLVKGSFRSYTGGKEAGVFPFTGILYDDGGIHFDDEATATIGDDLLLVGMTGAPDVSTEEGKAYVEELLAAMNVPVGFAPYTLKLGDDSSLAFTGASPLGWNGIIDYGKQIMDVAGEIGYEGMDKEKTPVEVGLLTDTVLPEVFSFGDTNLTVNGNGNALSGEITYTDNAGFIEDIKLGAENPLVLDMTEVTKPVLLGSGIVVSNLIIKMTPEQAVAGTPVVTWSTDDGAVAPAVHSDVKVYLPTGETKDLIWDAEMGLAYIGPVEARLTGPTHEKPVYTSFAEAIAQAAESGDTVTLMTNLVNYVGTQGINKSLTLDGAGHKIVAKPVTIHRDIFSSYVQSTSMLKLQSGEITIKNLTLDGDASHAYTYLVSADNSNVSLTTENVNLFHGGELMGDEAGAVKAAGAGYGAAVHLNNGATMVVKDGFFACTGGKEAGVFPFTGILVDSNGADVTFDLTDDSDTNPTVGIGSDLLLVGMPEAIDAETAQDILDEMKVPTRFIPYTLTLDDGSAYAFTGASPLGWNAIIDYGKQIMDVAGEMGYEGLDKETTPIEVGLLTDTVLPEVFTFGDTNLTVNGNGNALSGEIKYTDNAGFIENIELGTEQMPLVIDLTGSTEPVKMGEEITVTDLIIKMTPEQAKSGTAVIVWPEGDKPENPDYVTVAVVDPETFEPTGTKTLVWDEELRIAYIGPVEARLTGANHEPVYTTLAEAMSQAESGDTVKMLSDVALTNGINVTTAVTLDLNGKEIGGQSETMKVGEGKALTINDNSEEGTGVIATSILNDGGTLIITSGTFERPISASEKVTDPATAFALSGGTYSEDVIHLSGGETVPLDDVCVDGYEAVYNGNNTWSVVPDRDTVAFEPKSDDPDRIEVTFGEGAGEKVPVVVSDAWVRENFEDYYGTEETKPAAADVNALLDETQANGLKGWQNYLLGFDGSETVKPLSPDATAAGDQEHVIVKSFKPVTLPKLNMGISAEFVLGKGTPTRDAAGEITSWSWTDVQTLDEPTFAVTLASLEAETYWRIKAVFSQVSMEEGSAK